MIVPRRFAPILFSCLVSLIMVAVVSAVMVTLNEGYSSDLFAHWLRSFAISWPVAFPTLTVVAPMVRRFVEKVTVR